MLQPITGAAQSINVMLNWFDQPGARPR